MRTLLILTIAAAGCVKGNPIEIDGDFVAEGGTLAIEGCNYAVTTRYGAEAPKAAQRVFGPDPRPRSIHMPVTPAVARARPRIPRVSSQ